MTRPTTVATPISAMYGLAPAVATGVVGNGFYDATGNILFYVADGLVYDYNNTIIKPDSMGNVATSTGLAELNNPFVFSVYPNPSSGVFTLQVKGFPKSKAAIEVYNLTNECVYACNINNNETNQLNVSHLPNGNCAMRLRTKNKIAAQKIII